MEARKSLNTYVFNGRQKIAKPIVTKIGVPWIFEVFLSFTISYIPKIKKAFII